MMEKRKSVQKIMGIIVCLALLRGVLYALVIPVDQTPDEFHHFELIKAKQLALKNADEREKAEMAARMEYARYYFLNPESKRQVSVADFAGKQLPSPNSSLYYTFNAWILKIFSFNSVAAEAYLIRFISVILGASVVFLSFLVARELFPENLYLLIGVPAFITFIPQFSAMNGSINNDKLAEVLVSLGFLVMVKMLKYSITPFSVVLFAAAIGLAVFSKRTALFMIPIFLMFWFVYWWQSSLGLRMHGILLGVVAALAGGGYFLIKVSPGFETFINTHLIWMPAYKVEELFFRPELISGQLLKHYAKFFIVLYWSFWGVFGYMTIHLHHVWYLLVACVQGLALCGLAWFTIRVKKGEISVPAWRVKSLYLFMLSIVFAILLPFFRSCVLRPGQAQLTQGRYLFPVLIPISVLTVFGIFSIIPSKYHRLTFILGIIGLIVLDSVCLLDYLLLNFHSLSIL